LEPHAIRLGNVNPERPFHFCLQNLTFFQKASKYARKSNRKLMFTEELFNEGRQRILDTESDRKVAAALGIK
jgi:hypothetical protein